MGKVMAIDHQAPLSIGFSRQEYCSGSPFPTSGDPSIPGVKAAPLASPAMQMDSLPLHHLGFPSIGMRHFLLHSALLRPGQGQSPPSRAGPASSPCSYPGGLSPAFHLHEYCTQGKAALRFSLPPSYQLQIPGWLQGPGVCSV